MLEELTFFDRLNLATCAMQRAKLHTGDEHRFRDEYTTAVKEAIEDEACANNKHDIIDWILDDIRTNP